MKVVIKSALWFVALLVLLFLLLLSINWQDADLRPEVSQAMQWSAPSGAFHDNGYLIVLGIDSPLEEDAHANGLALLKEDIVRYRSMRLTSEESAITPNHVAPFIDWKAQRCDYAAEQDCVAFYLKQDEANQVFLLASQHRLTARYNAVKHSRQYIEVVPPMAAAWIPNYRTLIDASELARVQAVLYARQQHYKHAVQILAENAHFSRRLLKASNTMISHMVALSMVHRDARLLSELMTRYPSITQQYSALIRDILAPIPMQQYSMNPAFMYERAMQLNVVHIVRNDLKAATLDGNAWQKIMATKFFKPNATANLFYDLNTLPLMMVNAAPNKLDQISLGIKAKSKQLYGLGYPPYYLRNPVGKVLASVSGANYQTYLERHYDVEGYLTLVRLQSELQSSDFSGLLLKQTLSSYLNPYTQQPMVYDEKLHAISFEAKHPSSASYNRSKHYQIKLSAD